MKKVTLTCSNPLKNPDCEKQIERVWINDQNKPSTPPVCFLCKKYRMKLYLANHRKK